MSSSSGGCTGWLHASQNKGRASFHPPCRVIRESQELGRNWQVSKLGRKQIKKGLHPDLQDTIYLMLAQRRNSSLSHSLCQLAKILYKNMSGLQSLTRMFFLRHMPSGYDPFVFLLLIMCLLQQGCQIKTHSRKTAILLMNKWINISFIYSKDFCHYRAVFQHQLTFVSNISQLASLGYNL